MPIDLLSFVRKWNASTLTERSAAPQHFRDLCEVLGVPHPTELDEIGASYTYEKRVTKTGSSEEGFADVWKRGYFAWEYKSKGSDLRKAYRQLNEYHEALENPPLLIVCDFVRFEVHTKFENLPSRTYTFTLDDLLNPRDTATSAIPPLEVLRHVFGDFNQLRPGVASARVTEAAASDFLRLAKELELEKALARQRPSKEQIAHFLMRLVFCLFADSVGLLPNHTFRSLVRNDRFSPISFNKKLPHLFHAMSFEGGFFGVENIRHFNGGLFSDNSTIELNQADLGILASACEHDWSHIAPAIFGTLFERSLDADKRSMIGAHYTSEEDILLLIEPVVVAPLKRRWESVKQSILEALAAEEPSANPGAPSQTASSSEVGLHSLGSPSSLLSSRSEAERSASPSQAARPTKPKSAQPSLKLNRPALELLQNWAAELSQIRILDPACGSGNFLYVALKRLLDLWQEARVFGLQHGLTIALDPIPHPGQLYGIETDFYAHEIASIVVWIGFLQWKHDHGVKDDKEPLLQTLTNIEKGDAILRYDEATGKAYEPTWPEAEYIVGNPPFLGGKLLRRELGDAYVDRLFALYSGRVKAESDLVVYWFEKARAQLEAGKADRAGLLATQGIRGGANRAVLQRIQQTGRIFWAWSDRKWTLAGAAVHVSMVAFERSPEPGAPPEATNPEGLEARNITAQGVALGHDPEENQGLKARHMPGAPHLAPESWDCLLDGQPVPFINADLTTGSNTASALRLKENAGLCFMGTTKVGPFDIDAETARRMLEAPLNPNGRPNSDVVRRWVNASDITGRGRNMFIIDFGTNTPENDAALYELPFEYVRHHIKPLRDENKRDTYAEHYWIHGEPRVDLRRALRGCARYILTPRHSRHRLFVWERNDTIPDSANFAFTRDDDYFLGVLQSSAHEAWARAQGTQVREVESGFRYTPDSTFDTFPFPYPPGSEPSEAESPIVRAIAESARNLVQLRDNWLNPPNTPESELKKRTLTNLYNQRAAGKCTWLDNAHRQLDEAVFAAYGWPPNLTTQQILANLLALNQERAAAQPAPQKRKSPKTTTTAP